MDANSFRLFGLSSFLMKGLERLFDAAISNAKKQHGFDQVLISVPITRWDRNRSTFRSAGTLLRQDVLRAAHRECSPFVMAPSNGDFAMTSGGHTTCTLIGTLADAVCDRFNAILHTHN